jgi:hypothetical protein
MLVPPLHSGVCTDAPKLIVMEYMNLGDLNGYLVENSPSVDVSTASAGDILLQSNVVVLCDKLILIR